MAIEFSISNWSGWTLPSAAGLFPAAAVQVADAPDVSPIPPLLRRRLNTLGRACAAEILRHMRTGDNPPIVYCSRHGDIERTLGVLVDLARGEPVSPMNFSLTVHNAIAGIVSIHQGISANISSIAAGEEGLVPVLFEALGLLGEEHPTVLCVLGDVPLPAIYRGHCPWPDLPFAACFTVSSGEGLPLALDFPDACPPVAEPSPARPQPLQFIDFLSSPRQTLATPHNGERWTIRKRQLS
ncbi:MAG: beta-ketoacyl synthase chain length factor [Porticoccaceae bacterium]